MSQVRVAKGIPNQSLLKQTKFSNSLASKKNTKKYLRPPLQKKYENTAKYEQEYEPKKLILRYLEA
jgi:hypothetical protein